MASQICILLRRIIVVSFHDKLKIRSGEIIMNLQEISATCPSPMLILLAVGPPFTFPDFIRALLDLLVKGINHRHSLRCGRTQPVSPVFRIV